MYSKVETFGVVAVAVLVFAGFALASFPCCSWAEGDGIPATEGPGGGAISSNSPKWRSFTDPEHDTLAKIMQHYHSGTHNNRLADMLPDMDDRLCELGTAPGDPPNLVAAPGYCPTRYTDPIFSKHPTKTTHNHSWPWQIPEPLIPDTLPDMDEHLSELGISPDRVPPNLVSAPGSHPMRYLD